jgi:hypothetical protein
MARTATQPAKGQKGQTWLLAAAVAGGAAVVCYLLVFYGASAQAPAAALPSRLELDDIPFDGRRAFEYLEQLCALGPRPSGSPAMDEQQKLVAEHFRKLGGKVRLQKFRVRHPQTGEPVSMANLIVEWHPERKERILLAAHYDTRPFPDRDPDNPRGKFIGASDGASGTAILMELAHRMPELKGRVGVDFVLFDGEEFVFKEGDPYFLGSEWFAREYVGQRPPYRYRQSVLLDLVGDADLQIYPDGRTLSWPDSRPLVDAIWGTAKRLGVSEFSRKRTYDILDDHIKLHDIAGIPSCDIIDFDYPAWHTEDDVPASCSALSLAKVGWVVEEWLKQAARK